MILTYKVSMHPSNILPAIISALVMIIAGSSFVLSYVNLRDTAIASGIPETLAFMWPICLDAFLILASIYILRANMRNESPRVGWITLLTFTGISILFNVQGSSSIISMASHAIPPVSLCISLELLMEMLRGYSTEEKPIQKMTKNEESDNLNPDKKLSPLMEFIRDNPDKTAKEIAKLKKCAVGTVNKYRSQLRKDFPPVIPQLPVISSGGE
jgi:hypothetical protein